MRKYIEHLKTKPESHKKKVAFGISAGVTLMIGMVWMTSFSYFNGGASNVEVATRNSQNSPINVIRKGVANAYQSITGSKVEFVKEEPKTNATLEYVPE